MTDEIIEKIEIFHKTREIALAYEIVDELYNRIGGGEDDEATQ